MTPAKKESAGKMDANWLHRFIIEADENVKALVTHWVFSAGVHGAHAYRDSSRKVLPANIFACLDKLLDKDAESLRKLFHPRFRSREDARFSFIDLFAGIGGFRIAMQNNGGRCVFSSEWNVAAQKTYAHNFGETPFGDITLDGTKNLIPDNFDVLCAGFPCQAFSIAGYQKGFEDTRGTLFFDVAKILDMHRPRAFYLENVKNLQAHDGGRTFKKIMKVLEKDLRYRVFTKVMSPDEYANLPQNRERIFIVGFDPNQVDQEHIDAFRFPGRMECARTVEDCLEPDVVDQVYTYDNRYGCYGELLAHVNRTDTVYQWRRQYVRENKSNRCPTLTANMGAGGHNVPIVLRHGVIRKLTPRECLNFQGFPARYEFPDIAMSKCYMQAGNSVAVPLIQRVAREIVRALDV